MSHLNKRLSLAAVVWALTIAAVTSSSTLPVAAMLILRESFIGGSPTILMSGASVVRVWLGAIRIDAMMICANRNPFPSTHQGQPTAEMLLILAIALCPQVLCNSNDFAGARGLGVGDLSGRQRV